jgi:hypothetical protein
MARFRGHRALLRAGVLSTLALFAMLTAGCSTTASTAQPASQTLPAPRMSPPTSYWPTGSRLLCKDRAEVNAIIVNRLDVNNRYRFAFPAQVIVTSPAGVASVIDALCELPKNTTLSGQADHGVYYMLTFGPALLTIPQVLVQATGDGVVAGLGSPVRWVGQKFWHALGKALNIAPGDTTHAVIMLQGSLPTLAAG